MWGRAGGSTRLNMCTLLSLRRNNTRYLARDKCLNRKIPESAGAAAKLRISLWPPVFHFIKVGPAVLSSRLFGCREHGGSLFVIPFMVVANAPQNDVGKSLCRGECIRGD